MEEPFNQEGNQNSLAHETSSVQIEKNGLPLDSMKELDANNGSEILNGHQTKEEINNSESVSSSKFSSSTRSEHNQIESGSGKSIDMIQQNTNSKITSINDPEISANTSSSSEKINKTEKNSSDHLANGLSNNGSNGIQYEENKTTYELKNDKSHTNSSSKVQKDTTKEADIVIQVGSSEKSQDPELENKSTLESSGYEIVGADIIPPPLEALHTKNISHEPVEIDYRQDLETILQEKRRTSTHFTKDEIYNVFYSLVKALDEHSQNGLMPTELIPKLIILDTTNKPYSADISISTTEFNKEEFELDGLWSLGMLTIAISELKHYPPELFLFTTKAQERQRDEIYYSIGQKYGCEFRDFIISILKFNLLERTTLKELRDRLETSYADILQCDQKLIVKEKVVYADDIFLCPAARDPVPEVKEAKTTKSSVEKSSTESLQAIQNFVSMIDDVNARDVKLMKDLCKRIDQVGKATIKVVALGTRKSGKTTLACSMFKGNPNGIRDIDLSNVSVYNRSILVNEIDIDLELVDIPGEHLETLGLMECSDSHAVLILFDWSNPESVNGLQNILDIFKEANKLKLVIGNKSDLRKLADSERVKSILNYHKAYYYENSALDVKKTEKTFKLMIQKIVEKCADKEKKDKCKVF